ncbi:MAG: hypothetical protein HY254_03065 [Burkholderiales bacterium]|nr:hypothetical protein [Burkholderiales bacterium]
MRSKPSFQRRLESTGLAHQWRLLHTRIADSRAKPLPTVGCAVRTALVWLYCHGAHGAPYNISYLQLGIKPSQLHILQHPGH